jgi:dihydroorotase
MMGLELCFGLLLGLVRDRAVSLGRLVDALSTQPARIAGFEAPGLREGSVANIVLADPEYSWVPGEVPLHSKSRNTPFLKHRIVGRVLVTLAGGAIVFDELASRDGR